MVSRMVAIGRRMVASLGRLAPSTPNLVQVVGLALIAGGLWLWLPAVALVVTGACLVLIGQGMRSE